MRKIPALIALTLTTLLAQTQEESLVAQGQAASMQLMQTLGQNLQAQMKAGGPVAALTFCNEKASTLTQEVDEKLGDKISVKRVTIQPRNAANAALPDEAAVLAQWEKASTLPAYTLIPIEGGVKYMQPITINKPVCLKCHGTIESASGVDTFLKNHYPQDKATGYTMDALRGATVVTITH
ncbi:MAG: hypothetical protein KU37_03435 [Sulfuricurvum sp. PC08-66]|nr:MAG: hypothetical protein KU37_03435 [Sulfuricurvum sp. PC08-66]